MLHFDYGIRIPYDIQLAWSIFVRLAPAGHRRGDCRDWRRTCGGRGGAHVVLTRDRWCVRWRGRCYRLSADDRHAVFLPVDFGRLGLHGPRGVRDGQAVHELLGKAADLRLHRGRAVRARRARVGSAVVVLAWHGGGRAVCARVEAVEIPRRARAVRDGAAELSPSEREERGAPCVG